MPWKIYVASSWKNPHQPRVIEALRTAGHKVYDFRNPEPGNAGFQWVETGAPPLPWDVKTYRSVLDHSLAKKAFAVDMRALRWCEVVVMVMPAGRSSAWELGWAMGSAKRAIVLIPDPIDSPELMFAGAEIVGSIEEVLEALYRYALLSSRVPASHEGQQECRHRDVQSNVCNDCGEVVGWWPTNLR